MAEEERQTPTEEPAHDDTVIAQDAAEPAIEPPREDARPMGDEEGEGAGTVSGTWDEANHTAKERDDAEAPARSRAVRKPPTPRTPRGASLPPLCAAAAALLFLWGLHSVFTSWRLHAFCDDVQQAVSAPGGIGKLSSIRDWRVRDIGEGTLQVSRGDGAYTVYVWRLSGGGYLVDTIARRD